MRETGTCREREFSRTWDHSETIPGSSLGRVFSPQVSSGDVSPSQSDCSLTSVMTATTAAVPSSGTMV